MSINRREFLAGAAFAAAVGGVVEKTKGDSVSELEAKPIYGKKTHYVGLDPRVPGTTTKIFGKKPFKVMFIGAHPDDADFQAGSIAHKVCKAGGEAVMVSCCNGDKGHQWMSSPALAARRYAETQASAKVLGVNKYLVLGYHDCEIQATMEVRNRITRLIRQEAPNLLITHRCSDYHADHRAVGLAVRDAAYLIGVPLYCPETPVPETLPFIMYGGDGFSEPRPFRADLMVSDDDVLDVLLEAWACHESQEFEWLPPERGFDPAVDIPPASDHAGRIAFLRDKLMPGRPKGNGRRHRKELDEAWGGKGPKYAEVFELCEYGRPPEPKEIDFLRSIGAKWVGPEPKIFKKGESVKSQATVVGSAK